MLKSDLAQTDQTSIKTLFVFGKFSAKQHKIDLINCFIAF